MKKSFLSVLLIIALVFTMALSGCEEKAEEKVAVGDGATLENAEVTHYAVIEIENFGIITAELYGKTAPITVNNFVSLANSGYYNGLKFHRIIDGFMMQGGAGAEKDSIKGEFASNGVTNNLKHEAGVLSMARTNKPNSGSTQFFIMHEAASHLDGEYAAFGKVISGMDIVDRICRTAVVIDGNGSVPVQYQPVIKSVTILPGDTENIFTEQTLKPTDKPVEIPVTIEPAETEPAEIMGDGDGATLETAAATHYVTIEIANYGTIKAELYGNTAPISVENFVTLAESGFYNGLTFHRIIAGFMMQGGAPNMTSPEVAPIRGEFEANGITNNLQHQKGVLSMARTSVMDSATSQFFIMHEYAPHLDGQYAAFGMVIEGIEVVDAICESAQPTDGNGSIAPGEQPVITSITVETIEKEDTEKELPSEGNKVGNLCYGTKLPIINGDGDTGATIDPTKTGKITIINFWGTWCGPCVKELPDLDQIAEEYADSVTVIAIHSVMASETAPTFIADSYPSTKILFSYDTDDMCGGMSYYDALGGTGGYPVTVILDENGVIIASVQNSMHYEDLKTIVDTQLDKQDK